MPSPPTTNFSPLSLGTQAGWDRLIASVHPPSMLVAVRGMMSDRLASRFEASDVWQDTLLMAWRDRASLTWRGTAAFRQWLLEIARNRIRDLADYVAAAKREEPVQPPGSHDGTHYAGPIATTSPSRSAADRESAALLQDALDSVPADARDIVRLRLFEDRTMEDIASHCALGVEAVRYRFRHGLETYRRNLRRLRLDTTKP